MVWHKNIGTPKLCSLSLGALDSMLRDQILGERNDFAFFVGIDYENLPDFCPGCQVIGHLVANCRKRKGGTIDKVDSDDHKGSKKQVNQVKKIYVP